MHQRPCLTAASDGTGGDIASLAALHYGDHGGPAASDWLAAGVRWQRVAAAADRAASDPRTQGRQSDLIRRLLVRRSRI